MSTLTDRAEIVHTNFLNRIEAGELPASANNFGLAEAGLTKEELVELFHIQLLSRHLDRMSRKLQARGEGFYTIGSSGHEGNAGIACALRPDDMAFLHYRDAAFQIARSRQVPGSTPLWDMLLSFTASAEDPISGGRHKVLGSKTLFIPPQTSTIASHLPKAVGAAYSIGVAERLRPEHQQLADDSIVMVSFGDASLNHSTAQGAINTACWSAYQNSPMPLLFVCEDNGIGISTRTPGGWVEASVRARPALKYFRCNGLDVAETHAVAAEAAAYVRRQRKPAFLHMGCVRLYGHAGADAQTAYMSAKQIEAEEAKDPLLSTAARLIREGIMSAEEILTTYRGVSTRVERAAEHVIARPKLKTADDVMASLIPPRRTCAPARETSKTDREKLLGKSDVRALGEPQHMAKLINLAMTDLMLAHEEIVLAGEDVGKKGGVYGVTQRLQDRFGRTRVIDTLLDEQSILGLGIGMAHNGLLPMPEIQFLAYLHNAIDQLRAEAASLSFFSNGQFTNPMVIRIAGLGYQRGFGGHFHNENTVAAIRDIPGLILACPSNGRDAVLMLRECVRLAREEQRLVVFLEPIALYMVRDLHEKGDGGWMFDYPAPDSTDIIGLSEVGVHGEGKDLAIVSFANGTYLSQQAQKVLQDEHGIAATVIDLRWLSPLPKDSLLDALKGHNRVLIVDECREQGSHSEALTTLLKEETDLATARLVATDSYIATGPAYGATMPDRDGIISAALALAKGDAK
ncbi:thiamine pyrophosphate-dependent enzyme [Parvularcula marina]|uniref:2-oxoglutarate dehydrogenase E1 component n=1 Tax=Parvularcula marina TaxID=2292771 RepID=A0A371R833_9PROT|nr:thiamine pyrophosphate-dependent enzyme [Parvularcula marina]RFB01612.1 MFS transporter [Parvularcula marina]